MGSESNNIVRLLSVRDAHKCMQLLMTAACDDFTLGEPPVDFRAASNNVLLWQGTCPKNGCSTSA